MHHYIIYNLSSIHLNYLHLYLCILFRCLMFRYLSSYFKISFIYVDIFMVDVNDVCNGRTVCQPYYANRIIPIAGCLLRNTHCSTHGVCVTKNRTFSHRNCRQLTSLSYHFISKLPPHYLVFLKCCILPLHTVYLLTPYLRLTHTR